jgi:Flp pilus assembly protein TadG
MILCRRSASAGKASGQAIVEFSLVLPLLMLMVLGLADVARAIYDYNIISNSAREGAREAILAYNQCSNRFNPCVGSGPPAGSSLVGVDNAINRAGAGIVGYTFATDDATQHRSVASCTPAPNQGCVWVFVIDGTTTNTCTPPNAVSSGGTDNWGVCDFDASKQGGHSVVVEIEFKFQPLTSLVADVLGSSSIFWAKSEMKTEY